MYTRDIERPSEIYIYILYWSTTRETCVCQGVQKEQLIEQFTKHTYKKYRHKTMIMQKDSSTCLPDMKAICEDTESSISRYMHNRG